MALPIIGITTYGRNEENHFTLPAEYIEAIRNAGGLPWPIMHGEPRLREIVEQVDGLILAGGGDLNPHHYGGDDHKTIYMLDDERDQTEIDLANQAMDSGIPTLGICRGTQVINVARGGSLYEHLPDVVGDKISHRVPPRDPTPHAVYVESGSRLAKILGETRFSSSSWHHQGLKNVPDEFEVVAKAPDGVIEAIEMPDHPWLIAVQWHPELTAAEDPIQQRLFDKLVEAASQIDR